MHIQTQIHIDASPATVWAILIDFDRYPSWNPFVKAIRGTVDVGNQIEADLPGMTFKPTVLAFEPEQAFEWLGHLWVKGLFDGRHRFRLEANPDGSTTFHHCESFTGLLVPLFKGMLQNQTKPGFEEMNRALKAQAEQA